jgi:hypothetical protein
MVMPAPTSRLVNSRMPISMVLRNCATGRKQNPRHAANTRLPTGHVRIAERWCKHPSGLPAIIAVLLLVGTAASRLAYPVICIAIAADGHVASNEDAWHVGCQHVWVRYEAGIDQPGHTVGPHRDIWQGVETLRNNAARRCARPGR